MSSNKEKIQKISGRYTITIDDDPAIPRIIEEYVGMKTYHFTSSEALFKDVDQYQPVGVFVDVHLGVSESGLDVVPELRKKFPFCPILVITSDPADDLISQALSAGASDFVRKPLNPMELLSRLQARLDDLAKQEGKNVLKLGDLSFDSIHQTVKGPDGQRYLSPTENGLLQCLFNNKGTLVPKETIKQKVWGQLTVSDNAMVRKIHELRKAFKDVGTHVSIRTVYGSGFILENKPKKVREVAEPTKRSILVVDDDNVGRELILRMLQALGFQSKGVSSGADAVEQIKEKRYDAILMDMTMPGMDGKETSQKIRELKGMGIPIVAMSALEPESQIEKLDYINDFLQKPFSFDGLEQALNRWVDREVKKEELVFRDPLTSLRQQGKDALADEITDMFVEQTPSLLKQLHEALSKANGPQVFELAHKLKGRCATMGLQEIVTLAAEMEKEGRQGLLIQSPAHLEKINELIDAFVQNHKQQEKQAA